MLPTRSERFGGAGFAGELAGPVAKVLAEQEGRLKILLERVERMNRVCGHMVNQANNILSDSEKADQPNAPQQRGALPGTQSQHTSLGALCGWCADFEFRVTRRRGRRPCVLTREQRGPAAYVVGAGPVRPR